MLDKNAIGRSSPPTLNEVEKGAIRRFAEALAGDRIYVSTRVAEVLERTGPAGKMDVAVIEDEGRDEEGNLVFKARRTLVVRASKES